jgi:hypothetical protein
MLALATKIENALLTRAAEITLKGALRTLMTDEDLSDITLKANDGTLVRATARC